MELVVILLAMAAGAFIKGVTGAGLPQVAIPVMATFMGVEPAVVIMTVPGIVTNTLLIAKYRQHRSETRDLLVLVTLGTVGAILGTGILKALDATSLSLILAAMILTYIGLFISKPHLSLSPAATRVMSPPTGLIAGILQGSTGMSGPVLITYLHAFRMPKEAYVFSLSLLFLVYTVAQSFALTAVGLFTWTRLAYSVLSLVPILLFMNLGTRVAKHLSNRTFEYVVLAVMFATALKLIFDALND